MNNNDDYFFLLDETETQTPQANISLPSYYIPIIGKPSHGKSSFLNALIGDELIPTDINFKKSKIMFVIKHKEGEPFLWKCKPIDNENPNIEEGEYITQGKQKIIQALKYIPDQLQTLNPDKPYEQILIIQTPILLFKLMNLNDCYFNNYAFIDVPWVFKNDNQKDTHLKEQLLNLLPKIPFVILNIAANNYASVDNSFIHDFQNKELFLIITKTDLVLQEEYNEVKKIVECKFSPQKILGVNSNLLLKEIQYLHHQSFCHYLKYLHQLYLHEVKEESTNFLTFAMSHFYRIENNNNINNINNINCIKSILSEIEQQLDDKYLFELMLDKKETYENTIINASKTFPYCLSQNKTPSLMLKHLETKLYHLFKNTLHRQMFRQMESLKDILSKTAELYNVSARRFLIESTINKLNAYLIEQEQNRTIRIPVVGGYNVGKSSILNCLIGKNILPTSGIECTKKLIVIQHVDSDEIFLYKAQLCENNFIEEGGPIASDFDSVKSILKQQMEEKDEGHLILKIKIDFISQQFKHYETFRDVIEFIDFPGLDSISQEYNIQQNTEIIKNSSFFIFVCEKDINKLQNFTLILNTMNEVKNLAKYQLMLTNSLIIINKNDKDNSQINLDNKNWFFNMLFEETSQTEINHFLRKIEILSFSTKVYGDNLNKYNPISKVLNSYINEYNQNYFFCKENLQSFINNFIQNLKNVYLKIKRRDINNNDINMITLKKEHIEEALKIIKTNLGETNLSLNENEKRELEILVKYILLLNKTSQSEANKKSGRNILFDFLYKKIQNIYLSEQKNFNKKLRTCVKCVHITFQNFSEDPSYCKLTQYQRDKLLHKVMKQINNKETEIQINEMFQMCKDKIIQKLEEEEKEKGNKYCQQKHAKIYQVLQAHYIKLFDILKNKSLKLNEIIANFEDKKEIILTTDPGEKKKFSFADLCLGFQIENTLLAFALVGGAAGCICLGISVVTGLLLRVPVFLINRNHKLTENAKKDIKNIYFQNLEKSREEILTKYYQTNYDWLQKTGLLEEDFMKGNQTLENKRCTFDSLKNDFENIRNKIEKECLGYLCK